MSKKTSVAYRLSSQALNHLETITQATGATKTATVETALALMAQQIKGENKMNEKALKELMAEYGANSYSIEDRGSGAANCPDVPLLYDEEAMAAYGDIILSETSPDFWISEWQNPNTKNEYDYRIIFG